MKIENKISILNSHFSETWACGPHAQCMLSLPRPGHITEPAWLARPTWHWTVREQGLDRRVEAAHEAACPCMAKAHAGTAPVCGLRVERWSWHGHRRAKVARQLRRSCRRRPLDYSNTAQQSVEAQLKPNSDGNERAVLTGGDALSSSEQRHALASSGWGGITELGRSSETYTRGRKVGEAVRH
jgi:hypothetical protein